jgi:hypothetical protein
MVGSIHPSIHDMKPRSVAIPINRLHFSALGQHLICHPTVFQKWHQKASQQGCTADCGNNICWRCVTWNIMKIWWVTLWFIPTRCCPQTVISFPQIRALSWDGTCMERSQFGIKSIADNLTKRSTHWQHWKLSMISEIDQWFLIVASKVKAVFLNTCNRRNFLQIC